MIRCAVSLVGGGTVACWGELGRQHLEAVNNAPATVCATVRRESSEGELAGDARVQDRRRGARVVYYGPDLSSLDHLDGTWMHVLPAALQLERDAFITILSPDVSKRAPMPHARTRPTPCPLLHLPPAA